MHERGVAPLKEIDRLPTLLVSANMLRIRPFGVEHPVLEPHLPPLFDREKKTWTSFIHVYMSPWWWVRYHQNTRVKCLMLRHVMIKALNDKRSANWSHLSTLNEKAMAVR